MSYGIEQAEDLAEQAAATGKVVAFQVGQRFPHFKGVSREALALVFEGHGFTRAAADIREMTAESALTEAVSRTGKRVCAKVGRAARAAGAATAGGVSFEVGVIARQAGHAKAWRVSRLTQVGDEKAPRPEYGARFFVSPAGIYSADPVDATPIAECRAIADEIVRYATWLLVNGDTADVSRALTTCYDEAGAYGFISRGSYMAAAGNPGTDRLVACVREIRAKFYDAAQRSGVRCAAVAVTEHDREAVTDSIVDDFEDRARELIASLKDKAARTNVRASTLAEHQAKVRAFLSELSGPHGIVGAIAARFEAIGRELDKGFSALVNEQTLELPAWFDEALPADGEVVELPPPSAPAATEVPEPVASEPEPSNDADLSAFTL